MLDSPSKNLLTSLDEEPNEYYRLADLIKRYLSRLRELDDKFDDNPLVKEFRRFDLNLSLDSDFVDLVQAYCENQCTTFPVRLVQSFGFKGFLSENIWPDIRTEEEQEEANDELDPLPVIELKDDKEPAEEDSKAAPKKHSDLSVEYSPAEKILLRIGFKPDKEVHSGPSLWLKEIGPLLDDLVSIKDQEEQETIDSRVVRQLKKFIGNHFSKDELKDLIFELGENPESFHGNISKQIIDFIGHMERRGKISILIGKVQELRPDVDANDLLLVPWERIELLRVSARRAIDIFSEALSYVLSFYSQWVEHNSDSNSTREIENQIFEEERDMMRLAVEIKRLNDLVKNSESIKEGFKRIFLREEIIDDQYMSQCVHQILAYKYYFIVENIEDEEELVRQIYVETMDLLKMAEDFISYLKSETVLPEVVIVKRRITMNDGGVRLDCLHEDGNLKSYRFPNFVRFYKQIECFFYCPTNSASESYMPVILPVDFRHNVMEV